MALAAVGLVLSACSGGSTSSTSSSAEDTTGPTGVPTGSHKKGGQVTIVNVAGQTWSCQFNPFNPAVYLQSQGFVYEPLVFVNILNNQAETPLLASSYTWSPDGKSIEFTIRDGVKWSDGKPMTAKDVEFTFNLLKKSPALDSYALWTGAGLQSVTAAGNKVTMQFAAPAKVYFFNFANQVPIVPEHIWSTGDAAAQPETWADEKPVGTGPFTVNSCNPNNIEYTANPTYWQPGKPFIQKVEYPAYLDNGPANLDLATGKGQWGSQFIPNIKAFYLDKSPDNHSWSPPVTNVTLYPNLDPSHAATSKLEVRQAIAMAWTEPRSPWSVRAASNRHRTRPASSPPRSTGTSTPRPSPRRATTSRTRTRQRSCWRRPATARIIRWISASSPSPVTPTGTRRWRWSSSSWPQSGSI